MAGTELAEMGLVEEQGEAVAAPGLAKSSEMWVPLG